MKLRLRLALTVVAMAVPVAGGLSWMQLESRRRALDESAASMAASYLQNGGLEACELNAAEWTGPDRRRGPRGLGNERGGGRRPPHRPPEEELDFRPPPPPPGEPNELAGEPDGEHPERRPRRGPPFRPGGDGPPPRAPEFFAYDADYQSANAAAPMVTAGLRQGASGEWQPYESDRGTGRQALFTTGRAQGPCAYVLVRQTDPPFASRDRWGRPGLWNWLLPIVIVLAALLIALGPIIRRIRRLSRAVRASAKGRYQTPVRVEGHDEIAELATAFNVASEEIQVHLAEQEKREQALRAFLENTTHDVMIPLTVLMGHLSSARDQLAKSNSLDPAVIASAVEQAHYLGSLVQNLNVAAKLDAGEPFTQKAPVDLVALVERCVSRHKPLAKQRGVDLESAVPELPVWVSGDVTFIEQAVGNVLNNSIRYNKSGGHVAVVLQTNAAEGFQLQVFDDGPGIPDDEIPRLFERGFRGSAAGEANPAGEGIGLHIVHDVAKRHGWKVSASRSAQGGLQVEFTGSQL